MFLIGFFPCSSVSESFSFNTNFLKLFKANAVLAGAEAAAVEGAFQYGRHIGIAFQLVDDLLDFTSSAEQLGQYFLDTFHFQYGRHIGIAFQLVDDLPDFTSSAEQLGQYI